MYQFVHQLKRFVLYLLSAALLAACGTQTGDTVPPAETVSLNINLQVYNFSDESVEKAAIIVSDADGNVVDYKVFDNPTAEEHSITFNNVPTNGTVTALSKSTRHLTWPTEDDYTTVSLSTFDVFMVQNAEGRVIVNPYWAYLGNDSAINTRSLKLQAPCPEDAGYLGSGWLYPSSGVSWVDSLEYVNGAVDGTLWNSVEQSDGNISAVVWSQIEKYPFNQEGYTQPLQYLSVIDHDPNSTFGAANLDAYSNSTTTASLTVDNLPSGASVKYNITGIRKGAPMTGLQAYSTWGTPTSTATLANVLNSIDFVVQHARVSMGFSESTSNYVYASSNVYKFSQVGSLPSSTTWDYGDFPSAPDPNGVSLQQTDRLLLKAQNYGSGNEYAKFRIWTVTLQPDPLYIGWFAYAKVSPASTTLQYAYPKLPAELQQFAPNIDYDYVSANIGARSYDLYPNHFITEGTARFVYVEKRDNITAQTATGIGSQRYAGDTVAPEFLLEEAMQPY